MKKILCVLLTACLLFAASPAAAASDSASDASGQVKFGYIYNTPQDVIHDDAVYHKASAPDYTNTTWGSSVRVCPEASYEVIWMNTPDGMSDADVTCEYRVNAPTAGTYEIVIIGTGESTGYLSNYSKPRGISWCMDGETRYDCDCFPILSEGYTYDNDPETGYAMGMIYSIVYDLSAGDHTFAVGNHTQYGKAGRLNFAGFYIQSYTGDNGRAAVTSKEDGESMVVTERELFDTPYVAIDIKNNFTNAKGLTVEYTDSGSVILTCTETDTFDPSITISVALLDKVVSAEQYPYFALYLKTNSSDSSGEVFFSTSDSPSITAGQSVVYDYSEVEGGQILVVDMSESGLWTGNVSLLRLDAFNTESDNVDSVTDMTIEIYAAAFFRTEEDAEAFAVEGVVTDIDTGLVTEPKETSAEPATDAATEAQTDAPAVTDAQTDTVNVTGEQTTQSDDKAGSSHAGLIIGIIVGVAAVAVVAVIIAVPAKKKKK